ncbi:MAG TPA: PepSY domain-containing protein, partial [Methylocella sp.]|nr:PepSY domain-containing protein [Methylocella sp.]
LDAILRAAEQMAPPGSVPSILTMPRHKNAAVSVSFVVSTQDDLLDQSEVFVDPYTAKGTGRRFLQHGNSVVSMPFIRTVISLHASLLFGDNKRYMVGIPAVFLLLSLSAGVYLWWPRNGNWRHALTMKWGATPVRLTYDVHRITGLYLYLILTILLFSGIYMIFKPQVQSLVGLFPPVRGDPKNLMSVLVPDQPALGLDTAAAIADGTFPDGQLHWIFLPQGRDGVYVVGKRADNEPNHWATYRNITIDQYSGKVLNVQDRANFSAGERFLEWQYPLHSGEAFGNAGRAFILLTGFVPLILYVTGFIRWRQKRRARKLSKPHIGMTAMN